MSVNLQHATKKINLCACVCVRACRYHIRTNTLSLLVYEYFLRLALVVTFISIFFWFLEVQNVFSLLQNISLVFNKMTVRLLQPHSNNVGVFEEVDAYEFVSWKT